MKTNIIAILAAALCIIGCSSSNNTDSSNSPVGGCANPAGLYHITYTTVSGNCGNVAPADVVLPSSSLPSNCTITGQNTSADNCSASVSETCFYDSGTPCPEKNDACNETGSEVITVNSNAEGTEITGTISVNVNYPYGNGTNCSGTYNYTETKTHN